MAKLHRFGIESEQAEQEIPGGRLISSTMLEGTRLGVGVPSATDLGIRS